MRAILRPPADTARAASSRKIGNTCASTSSRMPSSGSVCVTGSAVSAPSSAIRATASAAAGMRVAAPWAPPRKRVPRAPRSDPARRCPRAAQFPPPRPRHRWPRPPRPGAASSNSRWMAPASSMSPRVNGSCALHARHQHGETRDRAGEHRIRGTAQRCANLFERDQRLLESSCRDGDERKPAGAMDSAQRMAGAHHVRPRDRTQIELQDGQFMLERGDVLVGFVGQDLPQRSRERDVADRDVVGFGDRGCRGFRRGDSAGPRVLDQLQRRRHQPLLHRHIHHLDGFGNRCFGRDRRPFGIRARAELGQFDQLECVRGRHQRRCRPRQFDDVRWRGRDRRRRTGQLAFDGGDRGVQRTRIRRHAPFPAERVHPTAETQLRGVDQCDAPRA